MKGVTSDTRNGVEYWHARVNGKRTYCGKGEEGREAAELARENATRERRLRKLMGLGNA